MIKKVAIVHTDFRLYWPSRLRRLSDYLSKKNIELVVLEISGKGSPYGFEGNVQRPKDINWICIYPEAKMENLQAGKAVKKIMDFLDQINPDIVIAGAIAFPGGAAAVRWCNKHKKHVIVFDDARIDDVPRAGYVNWIKKKIYALVDAMFIPAPSHDKSYEFFGFLKNQLFYGVNCVDNEFFFCSNNDLQADFLNKPYFLVVGRQIKVKNLYALISVFEKICNEKKVHDINLVLIGDGEEHEGLREAAGGLLQKRIFFYGYKSQYELRSIYRNAEALVLSSHRETWGLVVNEAMASGLPVLVSKKCGCVETLVEDGANGYVMDPDNNASIESALLRFVALMPDEKSEMRRISRKIINNWGLDRFCEGVWESLCYVCERKKRNGGIVGKIIISLWNGRYRPV